MADAYQPPDGAFTFKSGYPTELTSQWTAGKDNMLDNGAIYAFQSVEGLTMDGVAGPDVWSHLLKAAAKHKVNPNGYTYALARPALARVADRVAQRQGHRAHPGQHRHPRP